MVLFWWRKNIILYLAKAYSLFVLCEYGRKMHMLCQGESSPTAAKEKRYSVMWILLCKNTIMSDYSTFGCLIPNMRPQSDKSSEISQPTSSYRASWCIRFVDGCTIMRVTSTLPFPLCRSLAQCDGVKGTLLSHLFVDSERIPITPLPCMITSPFFPSTNYLYFNPTISANHETKYQ